MNKIYSKIGFTFFEPKNILTLTISVMIALFCVNINSTLGLLSTLEVFSLGLLLTYIPLSVFILINRLTIRENHLLFSDYFKLFKTRISVNEINTIYLIKRMVDGPKNEETYVYKYEWTMILKNQTSVKLTNSAINTKSEGKRFSQALVDKFNFEISENDAVDKLMNTRDSIVLVNLKLSNQTL